MNDLEKFEDKLCEEYKKHSKSDREKLALLALERQYKVYLLFSENKDWARRAEYQELFKDLWKSIWNDEEITEELWEFHDTINPENVIKNVEDSYTIEFSYSIIFAGNLSSYLDMLLDDSGHEECFAFFNLDFIASYAEESEFEGDEEKLLEIEMKYQEEDLKEIELLTNQEAVEKRISSYTNLLGL